MSAIQCTNILKRNLKMIKLWKGKWTLQDALDNPDKYFVFGDNDQRKRNWWTGLY